VKVMDMLYALMLPSGNDAAIAIAEHFGERLRERRRDARRVFVFVASPSPLAAGDAGL
jgi:hypothetical protein